MIGLVMDYPKRSGHFAHKFTRLIFRCCLANEIGPEACYMLIQIAHTEDAARYRGPVTFYNEQLVPVCGLANVKALDRVRRKAIDAGWLSYSAGAKHKPGRYFVVIPEGLEIPDGSAESDFHPGCLVENDQESAREVGKEPGENREESGQVTGRQVGNILPLPYPSPNPNPNTPSPSTAAVASASAPQKKSTAKSRNGEPDGFSEWYAAYPRHEARGSAAKAYERAIKAFMVRDEMDRQTAVKALLEVTLLFADSDAGKAGSFTPQPATWLNGARYFDDPSAWSRKEPANGKPHRRNPNKPQYVLTHQDIADVNAGRKSFDDFPPPEWYTEP